MILVISGTNRDGSRSLQVANNCVEALCSHASSPHVELISLCDLPDTIYNSSVYSNKPAELQPFIDKVLSSQGILVVAPEYNGSIPGALKYFIDLLPFPEAFEDRPVAFVGIASGQWAGLRTVEHLQHVFGYRNAYIYPRRVFIPSIHAKLDDDGSFTEDELSERISKQAHGFVDFCEKLGRC